MTMSKPRILYWDTTCFICFLNRDEKSRRLICEDILNHANMGKVQIWTSTWTIVETIRPRRRNVVAPPLPEWALAAVKAKPESSGQITEIWEYFHRNTAPMERLTPEQIGQISKMFQWPFLTKVIVDERVAIKAVELCRTYGLKPADSIHAASAILTPAEVLQRWDRDFDRIKDLIPVEEPQMISNQPPLIEDFRKPIGPHPDQFNPKPPEK
jgi:predicted nucleic acid-binding protein